MTRPVTVADIGEFGLLAEINALLQRKDADLLIPPGDDCAALRWPSGSVVVSSDAMVEGVHFDMQWTEPEDLAWKSLASAVSDLAAKGAEPVGALVTLGLVPDMEVEWILRMYRFWASLDEPWGCPILGGDAVRSPVFFVDVFVLGRPASSRLIRNSTARAGDQILVTGTLGDARGGLEVVQSGAVVSPDSPDEWLVRRFLRPVARVLEMRQLLTAGVVPTAMTDISDGLARTLRNLGQASGVGACVRARDFPLSDALCHVKGDEAASFAWLGGEEYELLLTIPLESMDAALVIGRRIGVFLTRIGEMKGVGDEVSVDGLPDVESEPGYDHFA